MNLNWLYVFLGGGLGSVCRFYLSQGLNPKSVGMIPWGTFLSNFVACVLLGVAIARWGKSEEESSVWLYLVAVGFCGGFSTFSTFSKENFELLESGSFGIFSIYVLLSLVLGVVGFLVGYFLG